MEFNGSEQYRPLSMWEYFGYQMLFSVPVVGLIFLIIYAFDSSNINRRNFARSYFCVYIIIIIAFAFYVFIAAAFGLGNFIALGA